MTVSIGYTTRNNAKESVAADSQATPTTSESAAVSLAATPSCVQRECGVKGEYGVTLEAKLPQMVPSRELLGPPQEFWNPNLLMFCASVLITIGSAIGYFALHWAGWISFLLNMTALHMVGTVIHDACHGAAHSDRRINAALGHGSAFMLFFSFPVFTRVHQQHHAHVNDPKNDPDHIVSTFGPLWFINARFLYHEVFFFQRKLWRKNELWEWVIARAAAVAVLGIAWQFGFIHYIFNYWFSPLAIVGLVLGLFFDYLPHRPFKERDRWLNARVYPSRLLNLLIGGQNYHLVHHLWPSVPWYKYEAAYYEMKPLLDAKGSPQQLGILDSPKDFWGFVYDTFIGIHWHPKPEEDAIAAAEDDEVIEELPPLISLKETGFRETKLEPVKELVTPIAVGDRKAS
jgi:beta-carotene hydroxylase